MAQRIQLKRSSIAGRRPDGSYLEPGELALNSNASDPGLFFEANNGTIIKAGPTAIGVKEPTTAVGYGQGETWYDDGNGTFNVYSAEAEKWFEAYATPYGGSTTLLYVGSQFPEASEEAQESEEANSEGPELYSVHASFAPCGPYLCATQVSHEDEGVS